MNLFEGMSFELKYFVFRVSFIILVVSRIDFYELMVDDM